MVLPYSKEKEPMKNPDIKNIDNWTEEEWKAHDKNVRKNNILQFIKSVVVIVLLIVVLKFLQANSQSNLDRAYDAGYNLGYYVAFLEDDVVISNGEIEIFEEEHINKALNFVKSEMSGQKDEYFQDGFEAGRADGSRAARNFPFAE